MTSTLDDARGELLACPFCGGEAERYDDHDTGSFNEGGSCIQCKRCKASSPMHFDRKENLISSWNARAAPVPQCDAVTEAMGEIANRAGNFMDRDAADWMPSIYRIACEAIGSDPWPMLEANGWKRDGSTPALVSPPSEAGREMVHRTSEAPEQRSGHPAAENDAT